MADLDTNPPREPERSLPSYSEPPLREKRRLHLDREEIAERDLKGTVFGRDVRGFLIAVFLVTITLPALVQFAAELRAGRGLPSFDVLRTLPRWQNVRAARNPADFWNLPPRADDIRDFEKGIEKGSIISRWLLPHVQSVLTGALGAGNEQAYPGKPGWLFYRPDVEYALGPPFLDPDQLARRSQANKIRADPLPAILDFRDQLKARGIELVVFPVPVKPVVDGEMLSASSATSQGVPGGSLQNLSFGEFKERLRNAGVSVFDPTDLLIGRKKLDAPVHPTVGPFYLETDTHWTPETMESVARALAFSLGSSASHPPGGNYSTIERRVHALGDIALMLKLPAGQTIYQPQTVTIHQVNVGNAPWRATPSADTLLLGDSFSNIFSLEGMGWGESAGFAEHLSYALGKPLDAILRNSDGAFATREILSRELARGRDRLAGKKLVVWEFAARELSGGNWKLLPMTVGQMPESRFFHPAAGGSYELTGTVQTVSSVPLPGSVPYKDHILTVQLADLAPVVDGPPTPGKKASGGMLQALVYLPSMRDNVWTPAARLRPGDQVTVRLRAWSDVSAQYEKINRSEPDDPALQLEEPVWGELER